MKINVSNDVKQRLVQFGPNKLFGNDIDNRDKLVGDEAITLFDQVWNEMLYRQICLAGQCTANDARSRLTSSQQRYFDASQEHRSFRIQTLNAEFIIQLIIIDSDSYELTQLWRVSSSDTHPKTLFITFETVEKREKFKRLSDNLGTKDEDLGLQLILDFMSKHPNRFSI